MSEVKKTNEKAKAPFRKKLLDALKELLHYVFFFNDGKKY